MNELDLFAAAIAITDPTERGALLDRACANRPDIRQRLNRLLDAHVQSHPMLDRPNARKPDATGAYEPPAGLVGTVIAGRYKLLEEIGDGGMGTVWMAEQKEPVRRLVAVKLIKAGMDSKAVLARFEAERQALAMMDHPNIAKVHDAGTDDQGRPFFVMELVKGLPLTEYCDGRKLSVIDRLDLFVQICSAVQHAHQKAVIHRDLKPSNVLVTEHDGKPVPKVIDFGLAKALGATNVLTERTLHTAYGTVVGTPLYMAPEQVGINALDVDTRTDIYALGVILYELLTGSTPLEKARFKEAAWDEVKRLIREEEPPRPSTRLSSDKTLPSLAASRQVDPAQLRRLVRGELDWIVMKALDKDRSRRYETANGLSRDVQRYLKGDAVEACPPTLGYRLRKAYRRNRGAIFTSGVVAAVLLAGALVSAWQAVRATRAEHEAVVQRDDATEQRNQATEQRKEATQKRQEAETAREQLRRTLYAAHFNLAQAAWEGGRTGEVLQLLDREKAANPDLCGFEWHYWNRQCKGDLRTLKLPGLQDWASFSAGGSRLASVSFNQGDGAKLPTMAFKVWDTVGGRELSSIPLPFGGGIMGPILSPDGTRIAFGMGGIRVDSPPELCVMDAITGQKLAAMKGVSRWTHSIAFSSDGKRLAAFVPDVDPMGVNRDADTPANRLVGKILIWDAETGRQVRAIPDVKGHMPRPAFSPDGTRIAIVLQQTPVGFESEVKVWDIATGKSVLALPVPLGGAVSTTSVAFSPDGKALAAVGPASSTRNELHVWDTASGRPRFAIQGPFRWYYVQLAFSPDSTRITCAGGDSRVGLWDAASGKELAMYRGHTANVCAVAFSRDGRQLLSADAVDSVKVWDAHPRADALVLNPGGVLMYTALSRDAQRIATIVSRPKTGDEVKVWNQAGIQLLSLKLSTPRAELFANTDRAEFSRNGDRVAYVTNWSGNPLSDKVQSGLTVWDGAGKELLNLVKEGVGFSFFAVALSPDGKRVAAAVITGNLNTAPGKSMVRVWEIATGKQLLTTQPTNGFFSAIAFSPDGTRLATIGGGLSASSQILVLDAATGSECARWLGPPGITGSIDFSPDGRKVAATVGDYRHQGELVVGDMASGELIKLGRAQGTVVFSPDGTRLAAHSALIPHPAEVSLWDVATGRQLLVLKGHAGMSAQDGIAFSPSGDRIVSTATLQGTHAVEVRTWDAATLPLPEPTK